MEGPQIHVRYSDVTGSYLSPPCDDEGRALEEACGIYALTIDGLRRWTQVDVVDVVAGKVVEVLFNEDQVKACAVTSGMVR